MKKVIKRKELIGTFGSTKKYLRKGLSSLYFYNRNMTIPSPSLVNAPRDAILDTLLGFPHLSIK